MTLSSSSLKLLPQSLNVLETQPSSALFERESVVACVCLYTLYRRLLPRHVKPDSSLHRYMWGVQKVLPMVVLCQKAVWYLGEFLSTHAPLGSTLSYPYCRPSSLILLNTPLVLSHVTP